MAASRILLYKMRGTPAAGLASAQRASEPERVEAHACFKERAPSAGSGDGKAAREPAGCLAGSLHNLAGLIEKHGRRLASLRKQTQDDADWNDLLDAKERRQPVELLWVIDTPPALKIASR